MQGIRAISEFDERKFGFAPGFGRIALEMEVLPESTVNLKSKYLKPFRGNFQIFDGAGEGIAGFHDFRFSGKVFKFDCFVGALKCECA